ncbi:DUF262 domain-containing protein [Dialister succinatiphilus]|uniref:DUF262 domain-containing protein n=1 Tax=Dialister succinatiphilus TaxID=487173 RepID=UPI0040258942
MAEIELDVSDIINIFKSNLKIENSVKSISHTFLNERYTKRIDYHPYFKRKYVWDNEKASYFIESILLGTEIPPIVLFDDGSKIEVIDGRQRYETIKRFLENDFALDPKGLKALTNCAGRYYKDLTDNMKDEFTDTKIRVLQFSIVNEPALSPEQEDKVKKEIFKRYNSGIIALKNEEIERAAYINDKLINHIMELLESDSEFAMLCQNIFVPKRKQRMETRNKINYILSRIRSVLVMKYIPIQSYASASSKPDLIRIYMLSKVEAAPIDNVVNEINTILKALNKIRNIFLSKNPVLAENNLLFETLYWGFSIVISKNKDAFDQMEFTKIANDILNCSNISCFWNNVNVEKKSLDMVFFSAGSHYYRSIYNRYIFIANYFSYLTGIDFTLFLKDKASFNKVMSNPVIEQQFKDFKLSKVDPASATIYDILKDVKSNRFIIRPKYQRTEVTNTQKASYLIESILLGIRIPPIFVYKRNDNVREVIDGQQRLLSILGFLKKEYRTETGKTEISRKNGFKLSKLRFLTELNGKDKDGVEQVDARYIDRILDFQIDTVEIKQSQNPNFNPIDLFLRLNSKPFPIAANTFEMWNAYVSKEYLEKIKFYANKYSGKLFKEKDTRMKNEELITMLAYLAYMKRTANSAPQEPLNIFVRNQKINARFKDKSMITTVLGKLSQAHDNVFDEALEDVNQFIEKLKILCGSSFDSFNQMVSQTYKNTNTKTNQNFYLLWLILCNISLDDLSNRKTYIFSRIQQIFTICQDVKEDNFDVPRFVYSIMHI